MTWIDLFIAPLYIYLLYICAYLIKPHVTDKKTAKYFLPGFSVKIIGAIAVGLVYQFYYGGGDTFNFFNHNSIFFEAFLDSPKVWIKLIWMENRFDPEIYHYTSRMRFITDPSSMLVVKIVSVFSLISFNSYLVISCFFATVSYSGLWNLYRTFYNLYPYLYKQLAACILFVPSVFFWGSGLLKDTITIGALGWAVYCVHQIFFIRKNIIINSAIFMISAYLIAGIKVYILLCLMPALIFWIFFKYNSKIKHPFLRFMAAPFILVASAFLCYLAIDKIGEGTRYGLDNMAETAKITAEWINYVSEKQGGAAYSLGDYDYSTDGMLRKALPAINVSLFRPYLWEVKNIVMLLASVESLFFLWFTLYVFYKRGFLGFFRTLRHDPTIVACLFFALSFSFAVGISTYNFGSLVRYKIPMMPFYLVAMVVTLYPNAFKVVKKRRKVVRIVKPSMAISTDQVTWKYSNRIGLPNG
jgi:hypothetical protein